ncbi:hypothetical protein SFC55_24855 [Niallia taxi]|uniref:hypothetical protein n=1 Tax=Niallia taxi TaxID=2499688 RepID=UPI003981BAF8
MFGLATSILLFNYIAFKKRKNLTTNQIIHIWLFTIAFQNIFDIVVELKYHAYWYFGKDFEWRGIFAHIFLLPPVNMLFLNSYPFLKKLRKRILYIILWVIGILIYETVVLLPEPWGYFNCGWWRVYYDVFIVPILFLILLYFYKWIKDIEKSL